MTSLTYTQRALLARRGILVCVEYDDGRVKCRTAKGVRYYTAVDLQQVATPSVVERFRSWIAGVAA